MIYDDLSGYVGLLSLCAFVGVAALIAEAWSRRWAVAAAVVAAAAFAAGTWVAGSYWLGFFNGDRLREGQAMLGRKAEVHFPLLLPVFTLAAVAGLACALALVVHGWRRARSGYHTAFGGTQRDPAMTAEGVENVARRVAVGCAVLLLLGPFGGRTTWEAVRGNSSATDAGGYNAIVVVAGVAALIALGFAHWARPGPILSLLGVAAAVAAFGLGVYATGVFVAARWHGGIWVYACWCFENLSPGWIVTPAPGPPFFALAALVGAIASVVLAASWLRQPNGDVVSRVPPSGEPAGGR